MRKTKIICTIGPSSEDPAVFKAMCLQGLNVARLNFSHGTHEEHQKKIDMIKAVRAELKLPIAIMLDTKGPEYRIRTFKNGKISLKDGGEGFDTMDEVISALNRKVEANIQEDKVVISFGCAILTPQDRQLRDVFERADNMMYERKKALKQMGAKTRDT